MTVGIALTAADHGIVRIYRFEKSLGGGRAAPVMSDFVDIGGDVDPGCENIHFRRCFRIPRKQEAVFAVF